MAKKQASGDEPLRDVKVGDWLVWERSRGMRRGPGAVTICEAVQVKKRTPKRVFTGFKQYNLLGVSVNSVSRDFLRLPKHGEIEALRAKAKAEAEERKRQEAEQQRLNNRPEAIALRELIGLEYPDAETQIAKYGWKLVEAAKILGLM